MYPNILLYYIDEHLPNEAKFNIYHTGKKIARIMTFVKHQDEPRALFLSLNLIKIYIYVCAKCIIFDIALYVLVLNKGMIYQNTTLKIISHWIKLYTVMILVQHQIYLLTIGGKITENFHLNIKRLHIGINYQMI